MRSFWSRVPMLRVVFALVAGICLEIAAESWFHSSIKLTGLVVLVLLLSVGFLVVLGRLKNVTLVYRLRLWNGVALTIGIICFAWLLTWFSNNTNYSDNFSRFLEDQNVLVVKIYDAPVLHDKTVMLNAEVVEVDNAKGHFKTNGNIQLNFLRDSICERLNYGDVLLIKPKIDTTEGPKNPDERNYKNVLAFHNIYHKAFVTRGQWVPTGVNEGNKLLLSVYRLRNSFLEVIARYVNDKHDFGVASAIMLGYRDYLSFDIYQAYANSGTVQVLSVSALHVLIMFFILNFLLGWVDKRGRKLVFAKAALIIAFIWLYACLTGLTLPVVRCATMFTLIQLGTVFIRNVNKYNVLAGSALLLMLLNPFVITEIGFQLSYLAVFGLYFLQPKIANLLIIKIPDGPHYKKQSMWLLKPVTFLLHDTLWFVFKAVDFIWQLIAASIAAQIAILPLCLFYFYQFPNLFLLSNIVVVPLSNLLIFAGTVLFAVSKIPLVNDIAGWIFSHLLRLMDGFVSWIDTLPYALTKGITISVAEMVLLYILIALLCWLTEEKKNKAVISALVVVLLLCSFKSYKTVVHAKQREIVVYDVPKQKAIAFMSYTKLYYDFDSTLLNDASNMYYRINRHWWELGIENEEAIKESGPTSVPGIYSTRISQGRVILFEGKKILIIDSLSISSYAGSKLKLKPDLVILSGPLKVSIPILKKSIDFNEVVFDSRCRAASRKRWKKDCSELDIDYWDVNTQGAYVWNLRADAP